MIHFLKSYSSTLHKVFSLFTVFVFKFFILSKTTYEYEKFKKKLLWFFINPVKNLKQQYNTASLTDNLGIYSLLAWKWNRLKKFAFFKLLAQNEGQGDDRYPQTSEDLGEASLLYEI